jgi:hypothetical protein
MAARCGVFRGLNRPVPIISFACNLPEFAGETVECINRLGCLLTLGFKYVIGNIRCGFVADAWLSRTEMIQIIHRSEKSYLAIFCRSLHGEMLTAATS